MKNDYYYLFFLNLFEIKPTSFPGQTSQEVTELSYLDVCVFLCLCFILHYLGLMFYIDVVCVLH